MNTFATPFASKPKTIKKTGATPPKIPTSPVMNPLALLSRLLNASATLAPNSRIGVTSFKNSSPIGAIDN